MSVCLSCYTVSSLHHSLGGDKQFRHSMRSAFGSEYKLPALQFCNKFCRTHATFKQFKQDMRSTVGNEYQLPLLESHNKFTECTQHDLL